MVIFELWIIRDVGIKYVLVSIMLESKQHNQESNKNNRLKLWLNQTKS